MDKVTVVERPGIERKSFFARKAKAQVIDALEMYKEGDDCCALTENGETISCKGVRCVICTRPLIFAIKEGHGHSDQEFEDKDFRVNELEKDVARLEREKEALHQQLSRMEAKHDSG